MTDGDGDDVRFPMIDPDPQLLADAEAVLRGAGFAIARRAFGPTDVPWLLAEDRFFLLAVAAGRTLNDVRALETVLAAEFGALLAAPELGAKRWDAHLVLLAAHEAPSGSSADAMAIQYDLRALRRIVAHGIAASPGRLGVALAPFLPLPPAAASTGDLPLRELQEALVVNGIPEDQAAAAIAAFEQSGDLDAI